MKTGLDTPVRLDDGLVLAAIARVRLVPQRLDGGVAFWADKTPLAVLMAREQAVRAFDLQGRVLSDREVESLCPGALNLFREVIA